MLMCLNVSSKKGCANHIANAKMTGSLFQIFISCLRVLTQAWKSRTLDCNGQPFSSNCLGIRNGFRKSSLCDVGPKKDSVEVQRIGDLNWDN